MWLQRCTDRPPGRRNTLAAGLVQARGLGGQKVAGRLPDYGEEELGVLGSGSLTTRHLMSERLPWLEWSVV